MITGLDKPLGPWTVYGDPRILPYIEWARWGEKIQQPLLRGELPWRVTPEWSDGARGALQGVLDFFEDHGICIDVIDGVAHVTDPRFQPLDDETMETCVKHMLVDAEDAERGHWYNSSLSSCVLWFRSARAFPKSEWQHGIPLIQAEIVGKEGSFAVVGRPDVRRLHHYPWQGQRLTHNYALARPKKRVFPMSSPRWRSSVRAASAHIAEHLPAWDAYLATQERIEREAKEAEAEAIHDAEMEPIRAQVDEDAEAGYFDGL